MSVVVYENIIIINGAVLAMGESRADGRSPAAILRKRYPEVMPLA
jgi:hypothetical protein